jgi:radical SAM protein with 4Fe4S-binding SPASM domain
MTAGPDHVSPAPPRLIAWELTRACPLKCRHCRAAPLDGAPAAAANAEFSTGECRSLIDRLAGWAKPTLILTGGEPLTRPDVYDVASYASSRGLPAVLATCGGLLDESAARRLVDAGVKKISISLDGASAGTHDAWRGAPGAFDVALRGIDRARRAGLPFQVNTTVTRRNRGELPAILDLAAGLGADVFNPFLLVPTGRGAALAGEQLSAAEYDDVLRWLAGMRVGGMAIRVTCAPHYQRVVRESPAAACSSRGTGVPPTPPGQPAGCLGGKAFAFVSASGTVQICGFLDVPCGELRAAGLDFRRIWETSDVLRRVRDVDSYRGRCGACEYRRACGGCRARAHASGGDFLGEEPLCSYSPAAPLRIADKVLPPADSDAAESALDELDRRILADIQVDFPIVRWPYEAIAARLGSTAEAALDRVNRMRQSGVIRRLGGVFSAGRLGYVSTLVAARVAPARVDEVAARISRLDGVTHNYAREHEYNLWFTVTARSRECLAAAIAGLRGLDGVEDMKNLPGALAYKTAAVFEMGGDQRPGPMNAAQPAGSPPARAGSPVSLGEGEKRLVRIVQGTLPDNAQPLVTLAQEWGGPVELLIVTLRRWLDVGVLRRFGAVLAHRRIGLSANGLAMFRVEPAIADAAGAVLARPAEVSHCYLRHAPDGWPWNLFAMIHGRDRGAVADLARRLAKEANLGEPEVVFSTVEYKKSSPLFFMEES